LHELGIAQSILNVVERVAKQNNVKKIVGIRIEAGEFRAVVKEQLEICFKFAAKGTIAEDARLEIDLLPIFAFCESCKKEFQVKNLDLRCITCKEFSVKVLRGQELRVLDLEIA
jgi:hydrogenase nickel incorporation protein HypA/HybF